MLFANERGRMSWFGLLIPRTGIPSHLTHGICEIPCVLQVGFRKEGLLIGILVASALAEKTARRFTGQAGGKE